MLWGNFSRNSCRQRKSALLRSMATLSMSVPDMAVDLRTVVSARRHLATRQRYNKHANCWETITARITDLIKLCQREQEGDSVGAQ